VLEVPDLYLHTVTGHAVTQRHFAAWFAHLDGSPPELLEDARAWDTLSTLPRRADGASIREEWRLSQLPELSGLFRFQRHLRFKNSRT
jgi:hypothetical protein